MGEQLKPIRYARVLLMDWHPIQGVLLNSVRFWMHHGTDQDKAVTEEQINKT